MKFEEEFPNMKNIKGGLYSFIRNNDAVKEAIRIHCLDKQKVKEVILRKINFYESMNECIIASEMKDMLKELGVDK